MRWFPSSFADTTFSLSVHSDVTALKRLSALLAAPALVWWGSTPRPCLEQRTRQSVVLLHTGWCYGHQWWASRFHGTNRRLATFCLSLLAQAFHSFSVSLHIVRPSLFHVTVFLACIAMGGSMSGLPSLSFHMRRSTLVARTMAWWLLVVTTLKF